MSEQLRFIGFVIRRTLHIFCEEMPESLRGTGEIGGFAGWDVGSGSPFRIVERSLYLSLPGNEREDEAGFGAACECESHEGAMNLWRELRAVQSEINERLKKDGPTELEFPEWWN